MAETLITAISSTGSGRVVTIVDHLISRIERACAENRPTQAIRDLMRLLRRGRRNSAARRYALCQLADLYLAADDLPRALITIRWGLRLFPGHDYLHYLHGYAQSQRGRWRTANRALRRACLLNPRSAEYHRALGWCLHQQGWDLLGEKFLRRAISLSPTHAWAQADLALCLLRLSRPGEALKHARAAVCLRPSDPKIAEVLQAAHRLAGRHTFD
ncbi:MAG: tetratricopeptide repeat protein [Acidobacteriota bacterium]